MSLTDDLKADATQTELRQTIARLSRQLDRSKASREELVAAVYRAAHDAASGLVIPPIPQRPADPRPKAEVAICILADWQTGKLTPEYNSDVAEQRVARYAEKVVGLIDLERQKHPINEARVYLLGDLVEGEEIFPGQSHRIDASLYAQLFRTAQMLASLVRQVRSSVQFVRVKGAIGNHGAMGGPIRRSYHPETNFDAML